MSTPRVPSVAHKKAAGQFQALITLLVSFHACEQPAAMVDRSVSGRRDRQPLIPIDPALRYLSCERRRVLREGAARGVRRRQSQ